MGVSSVNGVNGACVRRWFVFSFGCVSLSRRRRKVKTNDSVGNVCSRKGKRESKKRGRRLEIKGNKREIRNKLEKKT